MSEAFPPFPATEPEYLGAPVRRSRPRRGVALGAAGIAAAAAIGLGGWAALQLAAGGQSPASALPADTLAYLSVDLDPSAGQKIAAVRTLQKFPALRRELDLSASDDLRRWFVEHVVAEGGGCPGLDYDADVAPWIGDRVALAAVPAGAGPTPVLAVQVTDRAAATAGIAKLAGCGAADPPTAVAFVGDYALVGERQGDVDAAAAAATAAPLAEDATFTRWTGAAGDPGFLTGYVGPGAVDAALDTMAEAGAGVPGSPPEDGDLAVQRRLYGSFEGLGAVVRFADGGVEAAAAWGGLDEWGMVSEGLAPSLADLPATTAFAMAADLPEGWLTGYLDLLEEAMVGAGGPADLERLWAEGEAQTGLRLPEDVEVLLGDGLTVAVDGRIDPRALSAGDLSALPVAVRVDGDPAEITRVLDRLLAQAGPQAGLVQVRRTDHGVVVGPSASYVDEVVAGGTLGREQTFARVLPDADRAAGVSYLDFDAADGWAVRLAETLAADEPEVAANVAPLDALASVSWREDGVQHVELRFTTD